MKKKNLLVNRYLEMLENNKPGYFDVYEFELIIDHYIEVQDFKAAMML